MYLVRFLNMDRPGWFGDGHSLRSHDASYWYFTYRLGYGDCHCGCTECTTMRFKVFNDGTVTDLITGIKPLVKNT